MMKKLLLLLLAIGLVAGVTLRSGSAPPVKPGGPPAVPVKVARVAVRDMPVLLKVVGRAEAYESVGVNSRVDGQVAAVAYHEGQQVRAGEVLVRLDPADFEARAQQARANLARDRAQLAKARADFERYQVLKNRGFVSEEMLSGMRTAYQSAAATQGADQAALRLARLQLDYTVIRAPFAGIVGAQLVFPGSGVKNNDTVLAQINRVRPLYVSFAVPESHLARLRAAMKAGALPVSVSVPGDDSRHYPGDARLLDNAVDPATGTIQMKAVLENKDGALTPGQFVKLSLTLDTVRNARVVPLAAVQQGPEGDFVYVVGGDDKVSARAIGLLLSEDDLAVIDHGLKPGETVVTDGQLRLMPGARVSVVGAPPAKSGG